MACFQAYWASPRSPYLVEMALFGLLYRPARLVQELLTGQNWPYVACFLGLLDQSKQCLPGRISLMWPVFQACWASPTTAYLAESALCRIVFQAYWSLQGVLTWQSSALCGLFSRPAGPIQGVLTWQNQPYVACFIGLPGQSKECLPGIIGLMWSALQACQPTLRSTYWQNRPYVACLLGQSKECLRGRIGLMWHV